MNKLRIRLNKRAVSPVIATLLLIAIAVAAAVVTYSWVMSQAQNESTQSQTSLKMDQLMFGKASTASTNLDGALAAGDTDVPVDSTTGFADGDVIMIGAETVTIDTVDSDTALTLAAPGVSGVIADGAAVTKPALEGTWISIRNTGSIAATIDKVYIYEGDTLLTTDGITINTVLSPGSAKGFGVIGTSGVDGSYFSNLLSGGQRLPIADYTIEGNIGAFGTLNLNAPYTIRLITTTGFIAEGTYYTPGSW